MQRADVVSAFGWHRWGYIVPLRAPAAPARLLVASGATPAVDCLTAFTGLPRLQILVNGEKRGRNFRHQSSFVPDSVSLMGNLTVRETFDFSAQFSGTSDPEERKRFVERVAANLGLSECLGARALARARAARAQQAVEFVS